jgi:hypothetical protein
VEARERERFGRVVKAMPTKKSSMYAAGGTFAMLVRRGAVLGRLTSQLMAASNSGCYAALMG